MRAETFARGPRFVGGRRHTHFLNENHVSEDNPCSHTHVMHRFSTEKDNAFTQNKGVGNSEEKGGPKLT